MQFKILKKSNKSRARLGLIETEHGVVETPCLVPVATQATVKTLTAEDVAETRSQILISNTFHLHLKPGEKFVERAGGLHKFMNWKRPLMTDSGGYQVFSLGFGWDMGLSSKLELGKQVFLGGRSSSLREGSQLPQARKTYLPRSVSLGAQPQKIKIQHDGVVFRSPINGDELFLGPKESIKIQEKLGADIIFAFDECPPPNAEYNYVKNSLEKTHRWAKECLKVKKTKQALFGIVQGSRFKDLRIESAKFIGSLEFGGFGIGGEFGANKKQMADMVGWVVDELPERKPRHLLGVGYLDDMELIIKSGVDTFDCTVPTHYARRGIAFTSEGKLDLKQTKFLKKNETLDKKCVCKVCMNYKKDYISHLLRAKELTALSLLTFHNLFYFNNYVEDIRQKIKKGDV